MLERALARQQTLAGATAVRPAKAGIRPDATEQAAHGWRLGRAMARGLAVHSIGKRELLTRCIFSGDGGELHGLKRSSIHVHAGSPRGSGEHDDLAKVSETLRFLAAVVC